MNKTNNRHEATFPVTPLTEDLEALFAGATSLTPTDLAQLEKAASKLQNDPKFIADLAKGLLIEDILRAMEYSGITASKLAERIGKSRQYVSKVLCEDRRVNFTVETLAEFATALDLQLCMRMVPESDRMIYIRKLPTPVEMTPTDQFPEVEVEQSNILDIDFFESLTSYSANYDDSYEPSSLRA